MPVFISADHRRLEVRQWFDLEVYWLDGLPITAEDAKAWIETWKRAADQAEDDLFAPTK